MDIVVQTVKSTGPVTPSGIEVNAEKKIFAALDAIIIMSVRKPGKIKINLQKINKNPVP